MYSPVCCFQCASYVCVEPDLHLAGHSLLHIFPISRSAVFCMCLWKCRFCTFTFGSCSHWYRKQVWQSSCPSWRRCCSVFRLVSDESPAVSAPSFLAGCALPLPPSSVQSISRVRLFATAWIAARQASLSITNSRSSLKLMSIESMMPSVHLILCWPLLLLAPPSQRQGLFQWVSSSHEVAKVLESQL